MQFHCEFQSLTAVWNTIIDNITAAHLDDRSHESYMTTLSHQPRLVLSPASFQPPFLMSWLKNDLVTLVDFLGPGSPF